MNKNTIVKWYWKPLMSREKSLILIQSYYTVQVQRTSDSKNVKTGSLLHALFLETPSQ